MFYVYILLCRNETLYVGYSTDLKDRIENHKLGNVHSTKYRLPVKLIYYECFVNIKDAKAREKYLKSGAGREQLRNILKNSIIKLENNH